MNVHPVAELFPMMSDEELADLARDIKLNGQVHPIVLDKDGQLIDGRNRLKACEIAGILVRTTELDGQDPVAYILSANVARRHLSKGQTAMAVAMANLVSKSSGKDSARIVGTSPTRLAQANTVLNFAPELADAVVAGAEPLDTAYEEARRRKTAATSVESQMERLRIGASDLADQVIEERLALVEALAAWDARQRDEVQRKEVANKNLATVLTLLEPGRMRPEEWAEKIVPLLDATPHYEPLGLSVGRIDRSIDVLAAIRDGLEGR